MTQPTAIVCPNCGAGLERPDGDEYLCAYCGHRSRAVVAHATAAMQQEALARFTAQRSRAAQELARRGREAVDAKQRENAWVMLLIGGLFLVFALVCFGIVVRIAASTSGVGGALPVGAFGLFWAVLGGGLFALGVRYRRGGARERALRARGVVGRAVITSYRDTSLVVDGQPRVELVLQVEVPGEAPRIVKQVDNVPRISCVTTGAEVPVFVNPRDPADVLVDWWSA